MSTAAPLVLDPALIARLAADLRAARYDVGSVQELLGPLAFAALDREESVPARRVVDALVSAEPDGSADERLAVVVAAFLLGHQVPFAALAAALPTLGVDGAAHLGLVTVAGSSADPAVDLRPYAADDASGHADWWLASDLGEMSTGRALRPDHVLGAGGASLTLAQVTVRGEAARVLDLGTGCGIQAMHASRHAGHVVATDISARALAFARFNAVLNGLTVEVREGSMLEPVAGEQFDLVVSNPPFVITPRRPDVALYEYRDGGRSGDDVVRDLVLGVGQVLAPGGVAQMLGNWEHRRGQDWTERVGAWLDEAGLDGWVVQREVLDPAQYAETWIRDGGTTPDRDPDGWAAAYGAWLDDLASRDVEAVGFGILTLRRPADGRVSLRRLEEHTGSVHQPLGGHIAQSLAAHDWLEARSDAALLAERLVVAPDVTDERFFTPGTDDPNVIILRQGGGFGRAVHASTALAALVGACDGELTVGQIVDAIATIFDVPVTDLAAELVPAVRGLTRDLFLTPAPGGPAAEVAG
ncbi:methyltransferase [Flavimobilis marinus]|uniref:Methyltransferase small domain-containing protein n=1 Tax=Flavimobilis marinus TaxID=285351 RepID=A0A1I2GYD8_9MICO|nr:methyltransferase [Flavimobilis marinus]GHG54932.1 methyltransferase [Flavimobilis marinus]SFF22150.1 Methyltransferase small domain-containing protein [Flavimobilis marinus]